MDSLLQKNVFQIQNHFAKCCNSEMIYKKIMELGRLLPALDPKFHTSEYLVQGCQSQMFLRCYEKQGKLFFEAHSDALISAGLASILIQLFQGISAETILQYQPNFLEEIGIVGSLSQNRSNGLYQIHLRMKKEAVSLLTKKTLSKNNSPFFRS